ncbi:MAG TPA: tRNA (adenosine(37)-N6)-threonylcarbamoyltransferase complex ATPase subunit type 1 TsaE [Candidatus Pseudogracilibacillus intestinigallinarum]|uniref:tRNA threonylcarbamoyladenosine biosynthesis protein TsaE n=1 Tax=Candidatus Pseudogracilibacillus intestinigallinarum TaxID=2838742 RepID=A0A9D1PLD6_9BACI|nr:tRNA (adenosine(37)-N6)-threonylcarbamoyltransferase complex ATPase subunit type 1 TsaE [Candidatus Pseudogracilibacillus intestinigallinarum]
MVFQITTNNEDETKQLAFVLGKLLRRGDVLTLEGDLGAGKTTFTKGIAKGLGIKRNVTSPTFTILKQYEGTMPLYHIDAYRLEHSEEDIGFDEFIYGDGVTIIEWPMFIREYLPENIMKITIQFVEETKRTIKLELDMEREEQVQQAFEAMKEDE